MAWTIPGVIATVVWYVNRVEAGQPIEWIDAFVQMAPFWWLWIPLTPIAIWLARTFPLDGAHPWRNAATHLGLAPVFALIHLFFGLLVLRALAPPGADLYPLLEAMRGFIPRYFEFDILIYPAVLGATWSVDYYRRSRRDSLRAAQLEVQLANAHLQALKMQLQPHFLFNTLHTAASLMDENVRAARRVLARLSDLLRLTLDSQGRDEIPLERELTHLQLYLDIESERFSDRLSVDLLIAPEAQQALVPTLILQPLVENAVRHGIAPRPEGGRVVVQARAIDGRLALRVGDDGPGEASDTPARSGVGLRNTRARLAELYGPDHTFRAGSPDEGGFVVEIELPLRFSSSPATEESA